MLYIFQVGVIFNMIKVKCCPFFGYFVANLRTFGVLFNGLNDAVVYQNMMCDYIYVVNKVMAGVFNHFPPETPVEELVVTVQRYRPDNLTNLCQATG